MESLRAHPHSAIMLIRLPNFVLKAPALEVFVEAFVGRDFLAHLLTSVQPAIKAAQHNFDTHES